MTNGPARRRQMLQSQSVAVRRDGASNDQRTAPQWQPPVWVGIGVVVVRVVFEGAGVSHTLALARDWLG